MATKKKLETLEEKIEKAYLEHESKMIGLLKERTAIFSGIAEDLKAEKDIADREAIANPEKALQGQEFEKQGAFWVPKDGEESGFTVRNQLRKILKNLDDELQL